MNTLCEFLKENLSGRMLIVTIVDRKTDLLTYNGVAQNVSIDEQCDYIVINDNSEYYDIIFNKYNKILIPKDCYIRNNNDIIYLTNNSMLYIIEAI